MSAINLKERFACVEHQLQIIAQQVALSEFASLVIINHAREQLRDSMPRAVDVSSIDDINTRHGLYLRYFDVDAAVKKLPPPADQRLVPTNQLSLAV